MIKQQVAIKKLVSRNYEQTLKQTNSQLAIGSNFHSDNATTGQSSKGSPNSSVEDQTNQNQLLTNKLYLPLLFVKLECDSEALVEMDETRESLIMTTNKEFSTMNENHLFEAMGLTQTNEEELS